MTDDGTADDDPPDGEHIRRERVRGHLDDLRERFGYFPVQSRHFAVEPSTFQAELDGLDDAEGAARALVERPDDGAALLVLDREHDDGWFLPGGTVEPGEGFARAAEREVREETGIDCRVEGVLRATHVTVTSTGDHDATVHGCWADFGATRVGGDLAVQEAELEDARWWTEAPPTEAVHEDVTGLVADRLDVTRR